MWLPDKYLQVCLLSLLLSTRLPPFLSFDPDLSIHCLATLDLRRCWAAIQLSHHPEPSGHALNGEVDGLDIRGQHGWQFVLLCHTHRPRGDKPHLCKQEQKHPTPVWRQLSQTHALLGRVISGGWVPVMKVQSLIVLSNYSAFHWWSAQSTALLMLLDELLCSGHKWCLDLRLEVAQAADGPVFGWASWGWISGLLTISLAVVFHRAAMSCPLMLKNFQKFCWTRKTTRWQ